MKGMTGKDGKEFGELFKNLAKGMEGMGGLGGAAKAMFNPGAMHQFGRQMAMKERMQEKLERRRQNKSSADPHAHISTVDETKHEYVFTLDGEEKQEKSSRSKAPLHEMSIDDLADFIGTEPETQPVKKSKSKSKSKSK
jgi:hypothetical protein